MPISTIPPDLDFAVNYFCIPFIISPLIYWDIRCVIYFFRQLIYLKKDWEYAGRLSFWITSAILSFLYIYTEAFRFLNFLSYLLLALFFCLFYTFMKVCYFFYQRKKTPEQREKDKRDPLNRREVLSDAGKILSKGLDNYRKM